MRERVPVNERLFHLRSWRERSGVEVAFFDLDDTLIHASSLFRKYIQQFSQFLAARQADLANGQVFHTQAEVFTEPHPAAAREIMDFFVETLAGLRPIYAVSPSIISEAARITALRFDADPHSHVVYEARRDLLHELYNGHNARRIGGAVETVDTLHQ